MSRLRRRVSFAPAFVLVAAGAACGSPGADCDLDPCACANPPSCNDGSVFGPDAAPLPACEATDDGSGCGECTVSVRSQPIETECARAVCDAYLPCCDGLWDERCVAYADALCPDARCVNAISFGGDTAVSYATWATPLVPRTVPGAFAGAQAIAWSDRLAFSTTADATVVAAPSGWSDPGTLVADPTLVTSCAGATRVAWANLDPGEWIDLVSSGPCGISVAYGDESGFLSAQVLVDQPVVDAEIVGARRAIVSTVTPAQTRVFDAGEAGWAASGPAMPAATRIESCDVASTTHRDIVLLTTAGLEVYGDAPGLEGERLIPVVTGAFRDVACGDFLARGRDELAMTSVDGPVLIVDLQGEVVWSSATDLSPPLTFAGQGIDAGDLDGDGDVDLLVAEDGPDAPAHVLLNNGTFPLTFEHVVVPDLAPGDPMRDAELTYLKE